jgi:hypothetical protein
MTCPRDKNVECKEYRDIVFKKRRLEKKNLRDSVALKAAESWNTIEKHILPECGEESARDAHITLWVVIDANKEDARASAMSRKRVKNSDIDSLFEMLKGKYLRDDKMRARYYYHNIEVLTPQEYEQKITKWKFS